MKSLSSLTSIVICFILIFFLNYIFYGIVAAGFFEEHSGSATGVQKEDVNMIFIAFGTLIQSVVLTSLYSVWSKGSYDSKEGFRFGALMGMFAGFGMAFIMYGTSNILDLTAHLVDGIWYMVLYGICGATIAMVMKKIKSKST